MNYDLKSGQHIVMQCTDVHSPDVVVEALGKQLVSFVEHEQLQSRGLQGSHL